MKPTRRLAPRAAIAIALTTVAARPAMAQAVRSEKNMSLELAHQLAAASVAACQASGHAVTTTVVDRAGSVRAVQRADNAGPHTLDSSRLKAFTSASAKNTTRGNRQVQGLAEMKQPHLGPARLHHVVLCAALAVAAHVAAMPAAAQVPPSAAEVAAYSGLHSAAHRGDVAAVVRLAAVPAAREARDAHGRTPLHVATFARQRTAMNALLAAGADPAALDNDRYDAVTIAAVADDEDTLRQLLAQGASAKLVTSRYDGTALIAAAHLGHDGVVRQLIKAQAPLDHVNNLHWTALIEAIVLGNGGQRHQATLRALLDAGASTQLTDRDGRTPLQLARARGYAAMVQMLVGAGAR